MPVITLPPVVVDQTRGPDPTATDALFTGPFPFNGKLYCFGSTTDVPPFGVPVIYESTDNGATWVDITGAGSNVTQGFIWCWGDIIPNPEIITFAYPSGGLYRLQDFDLNTKTWGASYGVVGGPPVTFNGDCVVRLSDGTVKVFTSAGSTVLYSVCDPTGTWILVDVDTLLPLTPTCACVDSSDLVGFVIADSPSGNTKRSYCTLDTSNTLGPVHDFPTIPGGIGQQYMIRIYVGPDDKLYISGAGAFAGVVANDVVMWVGTGAHDSPTWSEQLVCDIASKIDPTYGLQFQYATNINGTPYVFFEVSNTGATQYFVYYSKYTSGAWSDPVFYYDPQTNPPPGDTDTGFIMSGLSATGCPSAETPLVLVFNSSATTGQTPQFMMTGSFLESGCTGTSPVTVTCSITIVGPTPTPLPSGGRGFIKFTLNFFNACLGREYLLYKLINRELLKCGVKPFCFCIDERDWGGNFSEHEEVPMGPPEGAIAFNPTGQIVTPSVASGDNVIFQFRIPVGYDGVILGQYHGYIQPPTAFPPPIFVEGSGDIVWRLEAAGRFVRDCGDMEVSIGSLRNMSPIAGGLQVRSENLIRYIVAVPNVSGTLTVGIGNIVAGLHLWVWPRK